MDLPIFSDIAAMPSNFQLNPDNNLNQLTIRLKNIEFSVAGDHFQSNLNRDQKRELFSGFVDRVTIETSSYCNRFCQFCPNEDKIRLGPNKFLDLDSITRILDDLKSINYEGKLLFHLYNEPLKDPRIIEIITLAKSKLPNCKIWFNTNGDYLTYEYLTQLTVAGLSDLMVSVYGPNQGDYIEDYGKKRMLDIAKRCQLSEPIIKVNPDISCNSTVMFQHEDKKIRVIMTMNNFFDYGYDRGGSIDVVDLRPRTSPCASPFNELLITHTGSVVPCCNIRSDSKNMSSYEIGTLDENTDIFDLYSSHALIKWRKHLANISSKEGPCATCTRGDYPEIDSPTNRSSLETALEKITPQSDL